MQQWEFLRDARRAWYWRRTAEDGAHTVSSKTFDTMAACVADAAQHGYVPAGKPVSQAVPDEITAALRQLSTNPLGRLSPEQEHALLALGLIRRWEDFIALTELGRTVLEAS